MLKIAWEAVNRVEVWQRLTRIQKRYILRLLSNNFGKRSKYTFVKTPHV